MCQRKYNVCKIVSAFAFFLNNLFQKKLFSSLLLCQANAICPIKEEKLFLSLKNRKHFRNSSFAMGRVKCKDYDICISGLWKIAASMTSNTSAIPCSIISTWVLWSHIWQTARDTRLLAVLWITFCAWGIEFHPPQVCNRSVWEHIPW